MDKVARPNIVPWPPILVAVATVAAWVFGRVIPVPAFPVPIRALGGVILLGGLLLDLTTLVVMRHARTNILPHRGADRLVIWGPFRLTRNPIYLGNALALSGIGLLLSNPWFVIFALAVTVAIDRLAVRREEQHLRARFGVQWIAYAERTPRWLGPVGAVDGGRDDGYSQPEDR